MSQPDSDAPASLPERRGDSCTIVIFGASGDLTKRKLFPALYNLRETGLLPQEYAVIGVALDAFTTDTFRDKMNGAIKEFATGPVNDEKWSEFIQRTYFLAGEFTNPETFTKLSALITEVSAKHACGGNVLFYCAIPPVFFSEVVKQLGAAKLVEETGGNWRRVIVEKPFGHDLESAQQLSRDINAVLHEKQIYRIDHYLGKETVQNILVFRFGNGIFEPIWNRRYIESVQLTVAETVGVEGRGGYYETAGVLRDVIQNHMFMLLCLVAMEPPSNFGAEALRNEKVKVLEAIKILSPEDVLHQTVRGQYDAGVVDDEKRIPYRSEAHVAPKSNVETFAALKLYVENWRWAGVPFYLRSGKALGDRTTYITITFNRAPLQMFDQPEALGRNRLLMQIQPEEGIEIDIRAKTPGPSIHTQRVKLDFSYSEFGPLTPVTGYERLLYDCMTGDQSLFHRTDMVEACWKVATPILDVWQAMTPRDFPNYASGTWGPKAADDLLAKDGTKWWYPEELKK